MNTEDVAANTALMNKRAGELAVLLNRLAWPEINGPYFPRAVLPHVVQGSDYRIAINYQTVMFYHRDTMVHRFVDLPTDPNVDVPAWLAVEFLAWVTTHKDATK